MKSPLKTGLKRATAIKAAMMLSVALSLPAFVQNASSAETQNAVGGGALVHVQATVIGIDAVTNSVTLRGPRGNAAVVDVDPQVGDVKKLQIGDKVDIAYRNAILLAVDKTKSNGIRERVETNAAIPASGGVVASARRVEVLATVQKVDHKKRLVTLRGPSRTEVLEVAPDVSIDKLKTGDTVRAVFVSAAAAEVTRDGNMVK
jgi:Cu/Ag efflux protein CusF